MNFIFVMCANALRFVLLTMCYSDLCAISFTLLFNCAGMHATFLRQCCVLISFIVTINTKFMNSTFMHINHPITSLKLAKILTIIL